MCVCQYKLEIENVCLCVRRSIMEYGSTPYVGMDPEKNGVPI